MFSLKLTQEPRIEVSSRGGLSVYATDGSLPNPFEAALASLAACAGVFAQKGCAKAGVSCDGIAIDLKPWVNPANPMEIRRLALKIGFPEGFPEQHIEGVLQSVEACPVKGLIEKGASIEFSIEKV